MATGLSIPGKHSKRPFDTSTSLNRIDVLYIRMPTACRLNSSGRGVDIMDARYGLHVAHGDLDVEASPGRDKCSGYIPMYQHHIGFLRLLTLVQHLPVLAGDADQRPDPLPGLQLIDQGAHFDYLSPGAEHQHDLFYEARTFFFIAPRSHRDGPARGHSIPAGNASWQGPTCDFHQPRCHLFPGLHADREDRTGCGCTLLPSLH